ncbi:extracellular solute-binding protein [Aestuariimicrobium sp. T2.26MG-19.2B]|uniref:extracellular solute-binding protein n=1 Tax=Aestuariimicrobium sp. T2.26MG-19.2B TaxID=3040679 RepID=UPI0024777629|nr:extracellular solute-binding protein [Aestuariimicrobium sp. T2.26MG-19.2B]CAI9405590.1 Lipoprotein LipO [Aestuariimicrobium sp. T2.26MG-19.2B]
MSIDLSRRRFLGALGLGAAAVVGPTVLAGCRTQGAGAPAGDPSQAANALVPDYAVKQYAKPDYPPPANGFEKIPDSFVKAYDKPPGSGSTIAVMTPLWGAIPRTSGNKYFDGLNTRIGSTLKFSISDGNTYGDKMATVMASKKDLPDWLCLTTWNLPARFSDTAADLFEDLSPYIAGDKVKDYPNLASVPTDSWRYCVYNGTLVGIPMPDAGIPNPLFYRADLFKKYGVTQLPTTPDEVIEVAKQLTDPKAGRYGCDDLWNQAVNFFHVPPKWQKDDSGNLVHRVETQEYRQALEWTARLFKAGVVHPDAVAGNGGDAKQRFESGKTLMLSDGIGGWAEALQRQLPSNPDYSQLPMPVIGNGSGDPVVWKGPAMGIFSAIKKGLGEAKVKEILKVADFLAAPFGTEEYNLVNYGVEGTHYTLDENRLPKLTDLGAAEVQPTYIFLASPAPSVAKVQYPGYVKAYSEWVNTTATFFKEPLFYGMNITEPTRLASIGASFADLEKDIVRGRKTMADLDKAIATWKKAGGEELRTMYKKVLDEATPK